MSLIQIDRISKSFGGLRALSDVSLEIHHGEIYGIIGPNGAGKTTLFNCISGVINQTSGTITFRGEDISNLKPHRRAEKGIARTFQHTTLFNHLTVIDNVTLGFHLHSHITFLGSLIQH